MSGYQLKSQIIEIKSFGQFEVILNNMYSEHQKCKEIVPEMKYYPLLFRGHSNSNWHLRSTLDRVLQEQPLIENYFIGLRNIQSKLFSYTNNRWNIDWESVIKKPTRPTPMDYLPTSRPGIVQLYEFMVYLRHHSFPSPLIDWTESPYIAAYFAFEDLNLIRADRDKHVAIYCYVDTTSGRKEGVLDKGMIWSIGPNLNTHQRHFSQQSRYTICLKKATESSMTFGDHETPLKDQRSDQDILIKLLIPITEQENFMLNLRRMNIGAYSLFHTEDSLVKTLAEEIFILNEKS